jgi:glycosyltransferase involved in cell wall biosynthesis
MEKTSIVIPTFNEEDSVKELYSQLKKVEREDGLDFEIIFINDGSTDNTLKKLKELSKIKIINFRKNFGQTAALDAGIKIAQGEIIITMDADLQNDPQDIPKLLKKISEGYDVVSGWRYNRQDDFLKNIVSRGANRLRSILVKDNIHDSGCTLKAYRKECFGHLDLFGEMHRFIPGLLRMQGFRVTELKVKHHSRRTGKTKYSSSRIIKGFLDMLAIWFWRKYSSRPLHLFGGLGLLIILISIIAGGYAIYLKIYQGIDLSDTALTIVSIFGTLMGVQLFIFGLLADIMIKNYYAQQKNGSYYSIKEIIKNP